MGARIKQIWIGKPVIRLEQKARMIEQKARMIGLEPIRRSPYRPAASESAAIKGLTEDRT
jgi:hypothetical protein